MSKKKKRKSAFTRFVEETERKLLGLPPLPEPELKFCSHPPGLLWQMMRVPKKTLRLYAEELGLYASAGALLGRPRYLLAAEILERLELVGFAEAPGSYEGLRALGPLRLRYLAGCFIAWHKERETEQLSLFTVKTGDLTDTQVLDGVFAALRAWDKMENPIKRPDFLPPEKLVKEPLPRAAVSPMKTVRLLERRRDYISENIRRRNYSNHSICRKKMGGKPGIGGRRISNVRLHSVAVALGMSTLPTDRSFVFRSKRHALFICSNAIGG